MIATKQNITLELDREIFFGDPDAPIYYNQSDFERASQLVGAELYTYLQEFIDHTEKVIEYKVKRIKKEFTDDEKLKRPKLAAMLLQSTTGTGKTHSCAQMVAMADLLDVPVLLVVRDHGLGDEFEAKLKVLGIAVWRYYGRSASESEWNQKRPHPGKEWVCQKSKVIPIISDANHRPAQSLCRDCEHGMRRALTTAEERVDPQEIERINKWFIDNGIKKNVSPCVWLDSLSKTMRQKIVIIPAQSFSPAMTEQITDNEGNTRPRLVIIDESVTVGTELKCDNNSIVWWLNNIKSGRQHSADQLALSDNKKIQDELQARINGFDAATAAFEICCKEIGAAANKDSKLSESGLNTLKELHLIHGDAVMRNGTAVWEKVKRNNESEHGYSAPLRAATAILASARAGVIKIENGNIIAHEISPAIKFLSDSKNGGVLMDATPSMSIRLIIERNGGQVKKIITKQNIKLIRHPLYYFGRGNPLKGKAIQEEIAQRCVDDAALLIKLNFPLNDEIGVIAHKAWLSQKINLPKGADKWGYWGKDHVGTDRFKHKPLCIFGTSLPSSAALKELYGIDRAALLQVKIEWPEWDPELEENVVLHERDNGDDITCRMPISKNGICRNWTLDFVLSAAVQAIGRVRGASWDPSKPPIEVHIFGGVPLVGLSEHGLQVDEYRYERVRDSQPDALAKINGKRHDDAQERYLDAQTALNDAYNMLDGAGCRISVRSMQSTLDGLHASVPQKALHFYLQARKLLKEVVCD